MSDYNGPKVLRKELGEMLLSKPKTNDPGEKPEYYIKITAKEEVLNLIKEGTIIELESPKSKYQRMLGSDKMSQADKDRAAASMEKIPKFVVKRLIAKIKQ
jgi:hypothetical protein